MELIHLALSDPNSGYHLLVASNQESDQILGYICYGRTPMTKATWDLYWIAADPSTGRRGIGTALLHAMEKDVASRNGQLIRLETGSHEGHGAARKFYEKHAYEKAGQIADFYKPGDDLLVFFKRLQ